MCVYGRQLSVFKMGTVLSFSPKPRKPLYEDINLNNFSYEILNNAKNNQSQTKDKNYKRHTIFLSGLSWRKFTVNANVNLNRNVSKSFSCYNLQSNPDENKSKKGNYCEKM
ncbi:hypothetical protein KUTeg_003463 [Tegillarca granosa]|uniref:Uncharacterized protein n=1 Tax=Tegillarca granosa TaxID=220873 RepID=A0ABQ9FR19_TEGGR|nr:hypothetical protein KUTeg_003463 [Tegillarca granosa]